MITENPDCGPGWPRRGHGTAVKSLRDLTIEAFVQVTQLQDMGILAKGKLGSGIPYALYLTSSGQVRFAFDDKDRQTHEYETDPNTISGNSLYKIAVTKRQQVKMVKQTLPGFEVSDIETTPSGVTSNRDQIDNSMRADYLAGQKAGLKGNLEMSNSQTSEASVSYGRNTTKTSRLELRGGWEQQDKTGASYINKAVGRRFIPANIGYALWCSRISFTRSGQSVNFSKSLSSCSA